jgi:hypothetical protein
LDLFEDIAVGHSGQNFQPCRKDTRFDKDHKGNIPLCRISHQEPYWCICIASPATNSRYRRPAKAT